MPSHYETLQVIPGAREAVIKAAYRALVRLYHPDLNPDNAEAEASMKDINRAYQILSNASSRAQYDIQQGFGEYSIDDADTDDATEENFSAGVGAIAGQEMSDQINPARQYDQPHHSYQGPNAVARRGKSIMRSLFFGAAVIFSLMVAAIWLVPSDPDLPYATRKNDVPELKLRLDKSQLSVPES